MRISDWSSDVCSSDLPGMIGGDTETPLWKSTGPGTPTPAPMRWLAPRSSRSEIGRASCRERVWQYVYISVVAVSLKNTKSIQQMDTINASKINRKYNMITNATRDSRQHLLEDS